MNVKPGRKTSEIIERDGKTIGLPLKIRFYPIVGEDAEGVIITDPDGFEYLDFLSGWCVTNIGYSHPAVLEAIKKQIEKTLFLPLCSVSNEVVVKLAEKLIEITPGSFDKRVWFGLSGSSAGDCVYKTVPKSTGKPRMLSFYGSYHGTTMGGLSLSGNKALSKFIGFPGILKAPYAYCYRCPYNRSYPECDLFCVDFIEDVILKEACPPEDVGGLITEPIQSDGGDIVPPPEFLPRIHKLCRKMGMLLVADEVKVGFGRSGKMFVVQHSNVEPDILMLGKSLASGMPLSACVMRAEILDSLPVGSHVLTVGGHPASCAASLAMIDVIEKEKLTENATKVGGYMKRRLQDMMEKHELFGDVRGMGLFMGVELVKDRETKEPATTEAAKLCYRAWELGLIIGYVGLYSNVTEITPPLILTEEQASRGLDIFEEALRDVEAGKVSDEKIALYAGW